MGRPPKNKNERKKPYSVSLTLIEREDIENAMQSLGYKSFTKYMRDSALRKKTGVSKVRITDRSIRDQINKLTTEIKRIGVLYNQVAAKVNTLVNARRKNGDYVINTTYLKNYTDKLDRYMQEIIDKQNAIIEQVKNIELKQE